MSTHYKPINTGISMNSKNLQGYSFISGSKLLGLLQNRQDRETRHPPGGHMRGKTGMPYMHVSVPPVDVPTFSFLPRGAYVSESDIEIKRSSRNIFDNAGDARFSYEDIEKARDIIFTPIFDEKLDDEIMEEILSSYPSGWMLRYPPGAIRGWLWSVLS